VYKEIGRYDLSRQSPKEVVTMRRALYPRDKHPNQHAPVIETLGALGRLQPAAGNLEKGPRLFEKTLSATRRFYSAEQFPNGHPELMPPGPLSQAVNTIWPPFQGRMHSQRQGNVVKSNGRRGASHSPASSCIALPAYNADKSTGNRSWRLPRRRWSSGSIS
jgi:hypothetical protein